MATRPWLLLLALVICAAVPGGSGADVKEKTLNDLGLTRCTDWTVRFDLTQQEACLDEQALRISLKEILDHKLQFLAPHNFLGSEIKAFLRHVDGLECESDVSPLMKAGEVDMLISSAFVKCDISETILVFQRLIELRGVTSVKFVSVESSAQDDGVVDDVMAHYEDEAEEDAEESSTHAAEHLTRLHKILFVGLVISCAILLLIVANYVRLHVYPKLVPGNAARQIIIQSPLTVSSSPLDQHAEVIDGAIRISIDADVGYHTPRNVTREVSMTDAGVFRTRLLVEPGLTMRSASAGSCEEARMSRTASGEAGREGLEHTEGPERPLVLRVDLSLSEQAPGGDRNWTAGRSAGMMRQAARLPSLSADEGLDAAGEALCRNQIRVPLVIKSRDVIA